MLERMRRKGNPLTLLVGMWTGAATLENCVEVPQRIKTRSAPRPRNCTAGDLPQRYRCNETPGHLHPNISSSNVHNSQTVEGASVSIERWGDKEAVVYVYNGILLSHEKRQIPTICFEVDGPGGYFAEWSKSIGEGQTYGLIHLGNIKISEMSETPYNLKNRNHTSILWATVEFNYK